MFKQILAAAKRAKKPASKRALLKVLRFQMVVLGLAFAFAILNMTNVMQLRANALAVFIFMALGTTVSTYLDIHEAGLKGDDIRPGRS